MLTPQMLEDASRRFSRPSYLIQRRGSVVEVFGPGWEKLRDDEGRAAIYRLTHG